MDVERVQGEHAKNHQQRQQDIPEFIGRDILLRCNHGNGDGIRNIDVETPGALP